MEVAPLPTEPPPDHKVVSSGTQWFKHGPAAWSSSGDSVAFNDGKNIVVANVVEPREAARFTASNDYSEYASPVWISNTQIAFTDSGRPVIGDVATGAVTPIPNVYSGYLPMWSSVHNRIGFFLWGAHEVGLWSVRPDGSEPISLAWYRGARWVRHGTWSPDGRFIAYYAGDSMHVAIAWNDQYRKRAPLFALSDVVGRSRDFLPLVTVSWLPDAAGFVFAGSLEGQPDLYLAMLDEEAIRRYVDVVPVETPTPPGFRPTATLPPTWSSPLPTATISSPLSTPAPSTDISPLPTPTP